MSRRDNLSRFPKRRDNGSVRVGHEGGIRRFVFRNPRFRFCRRELRLSRVQRGLGLLIALRGRCNTTTNERGIALLVCAHLNCNRTRRDHRVTLGGQGETQIGFVDAHERLTGRDLLADIDEPLDDLAGDAKA